MTTLSLWTITADTSASAVIHKLKGAFTRHGIPEKVVSDGDPQYSCREFEIVAKEWEFAHITSSPHYPCSNGLAEKAVHIAKSLMEKAKADKRDPSLSLLEYSNTLVDNFRSTAQLLMSHRPHSILTNTYQQLQPEVVSHGHVYGKRVQQQQHQKKYYERSARPMTSLQPGQSIRLQEHGHWKPAVVIKPADTQLSYHVHTTEGREYRRNRFRLLNTKETHSHEVSSDEHCTTPHKSQVIPHLLL